MNILNDSPVPYAVVQSDVTIFEPALYGVDVFAAGDLSVVTSKGDTITVTFPSAANGGSYPYRWIVQTRQILDTNTTLTDANLVALR